MLDAPCANMASIMACAPCMSEALASQMPMPLAFWHVARASSAIAKAGKRFSRHESVGRGVEQLGYAVKHAA